MVKCQRLQKEIAAEYFGLNRLEVQNCRYHIKHKSRLQDIKSVR